MHPVVMALSDAAERLEAANVDEAALAIDGATEACLRVTEQGAVLDAQELSMARQLEQRILEATVRVHAELRSSMIQAGTSRVALGRYGQSAGQGGEDT